MLQHRKLVTAIEKAQDIGKNWNVSVQYYLHLLFPKGYYLSPYPDQILESRDFIVG